LRRVTADPFRLLLAIEYIGKNGTIKKDDLISYIKKFSEEKKDNEIVFSEDAAKDAIFNLKRLKLVEDAGTNIILTKSGEKSYIRLFSGNEIYNSYVRNDRTNAMGMLQTNALFYSPEIRALLSYIYRRRGATKVEIEIEFNKKKVHNHSFNQFTIDTTIAELERLQLIKKGSNGIFMVPKLHYLVFAQLLSEEVIALMHQDGTISEHEIKDLFDLKYGLTFPEFSEYFSRIRNTRIPDLIIPGSYGKFSINIDVAKEVRLI
jgi:hypothetical protein